MPFCVTILDVDGFKTVNDRHGHRAGDELLKQFSIELRHARRATDVIGRWGGDEFILLLDCSFAEAQQQVERLREWICGEYTLQTKAGALKFNVSASIGLAEREANEKMKEVVGRADAAMYKDKATSRIRRAARET
jgi:diguanylate cyclase (GGDEF)-like protein